MKLFTPVTLVLILIGAIMLGVVIIKKPSEVLVPNESLASFQAVDAPLMLPADGRPRHRLHHFSAWQLATIPRALRFDAPMGTESGALTYNAQPFWEMNKLRGGHHTGDDINGIGGMNSDLGDPVYAVADGWVVYSGEPAAGWGKILVVAHRSNDGRLLQSMYAHLHRIDVPIGSLVARGTQIGLVGTANGNYIAHLHFEMRDSDGVDIGRGYGSNPLNRLDPAKTISSLRGVPSWQLDPGFLPTALVKEPIWNRLELDAEQASKLSEILSR